MKNEGTLNFISNFHQTVSINTGANGMVEVINGTNYTLQLTIFGLGTVYQAGRCQAIYKLPGTQGAQSFEMVVAYPPGPSSATPLVSPVADYNLRNILLNPPVGSDYWNYPPLYQVVVNSYQEGEIQWYPPFGLASPVFSTQQLQNCQIASGSFSPPGNYFASIPNLNDLNGAYLNNYVAFVGFDISIDENLTGTSRGTLTITYPQSSGTIASMPVYYVQSWLNGAAGGQVWSMQKTFPAPLIIGPYLIAGAAGGIQFSIPDNLHGAVALINCYYWIMSS